MNHTNKSLYLRAMYGLVELLDKKYLEPDSKGLKLDYETENSLDSGIGKYIDTLKLIGKFSRYKGLDYCELPLVMNVTGNA